MVSMLHGRFIPRKIDVIWGVEKRCPPLYNEINFPEFGLCPVAERIQPKIMQFVNNYGSLDEARPQIEARKNNQVL